MNNDYSRRNGNGGGGEPMVDSSMVGSSINHSSIPQNPLGNKGGQQQQQQSSSWDDWDDDDDGGRVGETQRGAKRRAENMTIAVVTSLHEE